ncbi:MAG TPA: glycoside hydrolase family 9 protein [Steroidobacteraceae bacterium]|nr:glycoside hydrolase family 9 protein [Steroidobacteraceae bacterium]
MFRAYLLVATLVAATTASAADLTLNDREYFSARGLDVLAFSNVYDGNFSDSKIAGVELIHHGVRTATNGDVRLSPTPEQWDPVATLKSRTVQKERGVIETRLAYPDYNFEYVVRVAARDDGVALSVVLDQPLPAALVGKAGFNLEFLPAAYFHRTYLMDDVSGVFPLYPSGRSLASGRKLVLAPEDAERRVTIDAHGATLSLLDGRNQAQNGWYVVRSLLPADKTGTVVEWTLTANRIPNWTRPAVIAHSQVGYAPAQEKIAWLEMDRNAPAPDKARLLRVGADGTLVEAFAAAPRRWGEYLRYQYFGFDFSAVREPGIYVIEAAGQRSDAFRIATDVYANTWHPTLDVYFPVQMDHMFVNEAYRVWHGASHLDDARQAAPNHEHFDLYAQGPTTDSPFAPGAHIPGLNVGGWFDAGDFDLRTQTHYATVMSLVETWETFRPERDETTVDEAKRHVEMHQPDGVPDILQQIEHGTLFLLAQQRVFGHAIPGIVEPDLGQYTHLGDASTKTDNRVDDAPGGDDRLAFTTATTALNYGSAAALAAASRALRGYRDALADECLATAKKVWEFEKGRAPNLFRHGNTTGGDPAEEELHAAVELLLATNDKRYAKRIGELWPTIDAKFGSNAPFALRALPMMDAAFAKRLRARAVAYREQAKRFTSDNPFGVPITRGGWAGSSAVVGSSITAYYLARAYPDLFGTRDVLRGLDYLYGTHPASNVSLVSGVGTRSKEIAYGNNRADFSFIAGGVVPGVLILKPDFPENKEDWPFLWGENEYVVALAAEYVFLAQAANQLVAGTPSTSLRLSK